MVERVLKEGTKQKLMCGKMIGLKELVGRMGKFENACLVGAMY